MCYISIHLACVFARQKCKIKKHYKNGVKLWMCISFITFYRTNIISIIPILLIPVTASKSTLMCGTVPSQWYLKKANRGCWVLKCLLKDKQ